MAKVIFVTELNDQMNKLRDALEKAAEGGNENWDEYHKVKYDTFCWLVSNEVECDTADAIANSFINEKLAKTTGR